MFPVHVTSLSQGSGPHTCGVHSFVRERYHAPETYKSFLLITVLYSVKSYVINRINRVQNRYSARGSVTYLIRN